MLRVVDYQTIGFIGNRHTSGKRSDGPLLLSPGDGPHLANVFGIPAGTFGWARFQYSHGTNTPFVANRIVTGGSSGAKARVLYEIDSSGNNKQVVLELITPTIPFRAGEVVTDNSSPAKSATLALSAAGAPLLPTNSTIEFPVTGQDKPRNLLTELFNPILNSFVPTGLVPNDLWWDYGAKRALLLDVSTVSSIAQWSVIIGATSGATGLVTATTGGTPGVAYVAVYSGTFQVGEQIDIVGGGTNVATVLNVPAPPTRGEWTVYHGLPNNAGFGIGFDEPPGGSDSCGHRGALGMETYVLHEAYKLWGANLKGTKFDASAIYDSSGIGGVCVGVVKCSATAFGTTWSVGEVVTAAGGWSAKVIGHDAVKKWVYVKNVEGTLAPGVITGATSGAVATALDNVFGWMKGAKYWLGFIAEVAAMTAKLPPGSHTMTWKFLQVATCDGDMQAPGGMGLSSGDIATAAAKFAGDLRIELDSPGLVISSLLPDTRMRPLSAPGMAEIVRKGLVAANRIDPLSRYFYLDGFELAAPTLAQKDIGTDPIEWETFGYVEGGRRSWRSYLASTLVSTDTNYSHAAVVTITSQSQSAQGNWEVLRLIGDPDMAHLPADNPMLEWNPVSTLDPDQWIWNELTGAFEILDVSVNACGWGDTHPGQYGLNVTLMQRLRGRYGRIYCFHMPYGGSAMQAVSITQGGTWDPDWVTPPWVVTQTMTVTVPVAGTGRFTASSGTPFLAIPIGTVTQITGSSAFVGAGGNNTAPMRGKTVSAVDPAGAWIELAGDFIAETVALTLTFGPHNLDKAMEDTARKGITWLMTEHRRIPTHVLDVTWQGEADGLAPATFPAKAAAHVARKRALFGPKPPGFPATPSVWLQPSAHTSLGTDAELAALLAAFPVIKSLVNVDGRFEVITTDEFTFKMDGGPYPRPAERHYSPAPTGWFHHDDKAMWQAGWKVDLTIDAHPEWNIPAHPNGPVAWLTGDGGAVGGAEGAGEDAEGGEAALDGGGGGAAEAISAGEAANIIGVLDEAIAAGGDVASYTINGREVTMRSLGELLEARKYYEAQQSRARGLRRTRVSFG